MNEKDYEYHLYHQDIGENIYDDQEMPDEYEEYLKNNCLGTYHSFLSEKKNSFFVRLITCVYCLCFWLCAFSCIKVGFNNFALMYVLSLTLYFLLNKLSTD